MKSCTDTVMYSKIIWLKFQLNIDKLACLGMFGQQCYDVCKRK